MISNSSALIWVSPIYMSRNLMNLTYIHIQYLFSSKKEVYFNIPWWETKYHQIVFSVETIVFKFSYCWKNFIYMHHQFEICCEPLLEWNQHRFPWKTCHYVDSNIPISRHRNGPLIGGGARNSNKRIQKKKNSYAKGIQQLI